MRIGIVALLHESNTFVPEPTTLRHFQENTLLEGEAVRRLEYSHHEIGGFFDALSKLNVQSVPLFAARAVPFGTVTAECFDTLVTRMMHQVEAAGPLDAVLAAPHGATVSERHRDADGYWLKRLREHLGPNIPLIATLDAHANLSRAIVDACDAIVAYRTNPHLDQCERGREAGRLAVRAARGEIRPTLAAAFPPMAINIEKQLTSEPHLQPLYEFADRQLEEPGVLSNSILLGFPYADVEEMGSSVVVVTDNDPQAAKRLAGELGAQLWEKRHRMVGELTSIEEAFTQCTRRQGPICLLDMGDNVGGGSPADSTWLAHAAVERGVERVFICLFDPEAAELASKAGKGATLTASVGGKSGPLHGTPFQDQFEVRGVYDGKFEEPEVRHGGFRHCDQGTTAVLQGAAGVTVMVTAKRMPPFSLRQLTAFGIDPSEFHILVAKGVNAPVAAYAPVCSHLIRVNTPGATTADMEQLEFQHRRRPLFPFERDQEWSPDH